MTSPAALQLMDSVLLCRLICPLSFSLSLSLISLLFITYYSMPCYLFTSPFFITLYFYLPLYFSGFFQFLFSFYGNLFSYSQQQEPKLPRFSSPLPTLSLSSLHGKKKRKGNKGGINIVFLFSFYFSSKIPVEPTPSHSSLLEIAAFASRCLIQMCRVPYGICDQYKKPSGHKPS